jgi:hypothetical protein
MALPRCAESTPAWGAARQFYSSDAGCDNDTVDHSATLKTFALDTSKKPKAFAFPGGGLCNDIALKSGAACITDTPPPSK